MERQSNQLFIGNCVAWVIFASLALVCFVSHYQALSTYIGILFSLFYLTQYTTTQHYKFSNPLPVLLAHHKKAFLQALFSSSYIIIYISVCVLFYRQYLITTPYVYFSKNSALHLTSIGCAALIALFPITAHMAYRASKRNILLMGIVGNCTTALAMFMTASMSSLYILGWLQVFFAIFSACTIIPILMQQIELFPESIRHITLVLVWTISFSLFLTTPQLANLLIQHTHKLLLPVEFICTLALFLAFLVFHRQQKRPSIFDLRHK